MRKSRTKHLRSAVPGVPRPALGIVQAGQPAATVIVPPEEELLSAPELPEPLFSASVDAFEDDDQFVLLRSLIDFPFNGLGAFSDDRSPETNIKLRYIVVKMNNLAEFKTPSLRNVADTAPYMHDGRFTTLREVIDHYSDLKTDPPLGHREETLVPLNFSDREKNDLEAFLKTLTGAPLDPALLKAPGM